MSVIQTTVPTTIIVSNFPAVQPVSGTVDISNRLFSKPFNEITVLSKNNDGNPLTVQTYKNNIPVQLLTISYDIDGDFQSAEVTDV